jgi:hypothetical protein
MSDKVLQKSRGAVFGLINLVSLYFLSVVRSVEGKFGFPPPPPHEILLAAPWMGQGAFSVVNSGKRKWGKVYKIRKNY